jgi:hypothetical protein
MRNNSKKQAEKQLFSLDSFLRGVAEYSPLFILIAILIAYLFSFILDFKYYADFVFAPLQSNGLGTGLGAFVAGFVFLVRSVTAFHSINNFSNGHRKAGLLSFGLTLSITVFLLWEASKEAQALCSSFPINLDAGTNIIRVIIGVSFIMELLIISTVWEKLVSQDDDEEDDNGEATHHIKHLGTPLTSLNGTMASTNHNANSLPRGHIGFNISSPTVATDTKPVATAGTSEADHNLKIKELIRTKVQTFKNKLETKQGTPETNMTQVATAFATIDEIIRTHGKTISSATYYKVAEEKDSYAKILYDLGYTVLKAV